MSTADRDDTLAAEYVLGLLEGEDLEAAERRLAGGDRGFQVAVAGWRTRLEELDGTADPVQPSETLWAGIEAALPAAAAATSAAVARRARPARPMGPAPRVRVWNSLPFWRTSALASAAATLALAVGLGAALIGPAPQPTLVAVLLTDAAEPGALVEAFADGRVRLIPLSEIPVPEGRALQVWTLQSREQGPEPVALLREARTVRLATEALAPVQPSHLFEITLEPASGSPTGRPTGPVLMKGLANATR